MRRIECPMTSPTISLTVRPASERNWAIGKSFQPEPRWYARWNTKGRPRLEPTTLGAGQFAVKRKKTGQICWREKHSVSDLELSSLAGFFAFIWSNLCTRNIQKKITSRGHHDWPDKRRSNRLTIFEIAGAATVGK